MGPSHAKVRQAVWIGLLAALLETVKMVLAPLPNVELVTFLVVVFTKRFGWKISLPAVIVFTLFEMIWHGGGIWVASYLFVWPLLVLLTTFMKSEDLIINAVFCGMFGLCFGALCAIITWIVMGFRAAVAWWIAGLVFDVVHGISNFIVCLCMYKPCMRALARL